MFLLTYKIIKSSEVSLITNESTPYTWVPGQSLQDHTSLSYPKLTCNGLNTNSPGTLFSSDLYFHSLYNNCALKFAYENILSVCIAVYNITAVSNFPLHPQPAILSKNYMYLTKHTFKIDACGSAPLSYPEQF